MRAIITRHYKTLINANKEILGWGDSPRHKGWKADVVFVDSRLKKHEISFDAVYSSDLERARQTAIFHAKCFGIDIIHDTPALKEVNYGDLYKKKKKWVTENYPQYKTDPDFVYPQGESFRQMQQRSVNYLSYLAEAYPQLTILVVAHAGVIRGLVSYFLGLNYAEHLKHKISHRYIGDFQFEGASCVRYDELGKPSGFVSGGAIKIPFQCPVAGLPIISSESKPVPVFSTRPVIGL
jgi:broad specificity phosphatase PhoE